MSTKVPNNIVGDIPGLNKISIKDILFKYFSYFPLFILCVVICFTIGQLYIRYTTPLYRATTSMLVKNATQSGNAASNANNGNFLQNALFGNQVNLDNEMELLRSRTLIERAVIKNDLNVNYYSEGAINRLDVYRATPFVCKFIVPDSSVFYQVSIVNIDSSGGQLKLNNAMVRFKWNDTLMVENFKVVFSKRFDKAQMSATKDLYNIIWQPPAYTAGFIQGRLGVNIVGKTTIVQLNVRIENPYRGEDILNALIREYQISNLEVQAAQAIATQKFIQERLDSVKTELKKVENNLLKMQDTVQLQNITSAFENYNAKKNNAERNQDNAILQLKILDLLQNSLEKSNEENAVIPVNLLSRDNSILDALITKYNFDKTEYLRLQQLQTENSAFLEDLKLQMRETLKKIKATIPVVKEAIMADLRLANEKLTEAERFISGVTRKDAQVQEIVRQKEIKEQLFLYLLQKSEEAGIASVSNNSGYQQLDQASSSSVPIEPKPTNIRTFSILIGLIIPIIIIFLLDLFNDKITTRDDILSKLDLPILGEIGHNEKVESLVVGKIRSLGAEQFRILRSNLQFMLSEQKKEAKTILITSSVSGEGKSFISLNLAAVLTMAGKKVALMEFDLRKISRLKELSENHHIRGITNFLINQIDDVETMYYSIDGFDNLHVYGAGPIPPNPAELLLSERVSELVKRVQAKYDYVILDSAPIGLVSDSYALSSMADLVLYIVRQRFTFKKQLEFISEVANVGKFQNLALVVNDVRMGGRYGYYGYSYGYGYGYAYKYGYGTYGNKYTYGGANTYFDDSKFEKKQPRWKRFITQLFNRS